MQTSSINFNGNPLRKLLPQKSKTPQLAKPLTDEQIESKVLTHALKQQAKISIPVAILALGSLFGSYKFDDVSATKKLQETFPTAQADKFIQNQKILNQNSPICRDGNKYARAVIDSAKAKGYPISPGELFGVAAAKVAGGPR